MTRTEILQKWLDAPTEDGWNELVQDVDKWEASRAKRETPHGVGEKVFAVPVVFTVLTEVFVRANDEEEAMEHSEDAPLPHRSTWDYLDDSWEIDEGRDVEEVE